jgi:hypothetical protein
LPSNGNCIPFSCAQGYGVATYQEVYSSSAFPGPILIGGIDFPNTQLPGGSPAGGTFTFSLSYTSRPIGALDLTNPLNNITSGSQPFFSGTLPALSGGLLSFSGAPFLYNPSINNLLLTVTVANATTPIQFVFLDQSLFGTQLSGAYFGTIGNFFATGLVTHFDALAPEPSSWALVALGLASLRRASRKRT